MNTHRKTGIIVGVLFLTATVTGMLGDSLVGSILNAPDYLMNVYPNRTQVIIGALISFILGLAIVGIAVFLFPILRKHNEPIALGYVSIRTAEFAILLVWSISPLLLITLSQEYIKAGGPDASPSGPMGNFQTLGAVLIALRHWGWRLVYILNGVLTLMLAYLLYQSKLIPRSISVLGLIGGAVLLLGTALDMFGLIDVDQGAGLLAVLPGGLFELILPIWLFVKGFNSSAIASASAKTEISGAKLAHRN
jgi:hypothetical protein